MARRAHHHRASAPRTRPSSRLRRGTIPSSAAPCPLAERMRPRTLDEFVGQEHLLAPGQAPRPRHRRRSRALDDPLGPARHRQDHARARHRRTPPTRASSRSAPCSAASRSCARSWPRPKKARPTRASARSSSSTRSTASTRPSRTPSCRTSRTAPSRSSAPPPRTRRSRSTRALLSRCKVFLLAAARRRASSSRCSRARSRSRPRPRRAALDAPTTTRSQADRRARAGRRAPRARRRSRSPRPSRRATAATRDHARGRRAAPASSKTLLYDKAGEEHYNVISAFIKSMRGSRPGRRDLLADAHARGRRRSALRRSAA